MTIHNFELHLPFEMGMLENLNKKFNNIFVSTGKYDLFDYRNNNNSIMIEHKRRHNNFDCYPSTIIGQNKIYKALECLDNKYIFIFEFDDCIKYYKFDELHLLTFKNKYIFNKIHIEIPNKYLNDFDTLDL
jgi:hypothetical protein